MNFEPVGWDRPLESLFILGVPSPATTEYAGIMPIAKILKGDSVTIRLMLHAQQNDEYSAERAEIYDRRRRMDFDFELLGPRREGGSDERTRSSSDVSSQFDLLPGSRFGIATLCKRYPLQFFSHHMAEERFKGLLTFA